METFNIFLMVMTAIALVVFVSLFFVDAGYGKFYNPKWGPAVDNRLGWVLMEAPVFIAMLLLALLSPRRGDPARLAMLLVFEAHYFQRSFIFPLLIRGRGRMPLSIILMGVLFNTLNALMQGGWIFYISAPERYPVEWLWSPQFICGLLIFAAGMYINISSDAIIRNLRKPGDTAHYLPTAGLFSRVSSANYFGELLEWIGFAVLTWSWAGAVFALWTFANLGPRADRIRKRYMEEFPGQVDPARVKRMIPFIY